MSQTDSYRLANCSSSQLKGGLAAPFFVQYTHASEPYIALVWTRLA